MLDVTNLECVRGDRPLFSRLSFRLKPGELLHIVGKNGSGKTTLLRTLCGLTHAVTGEIRWQGLAIHELGDEYRRQLSYVGHSNGIQGELTPEENLRTASCLSKKPNASFIKDTLQRLGLAAYRSFPAKVLSQGQKRRLALARLVIQKKSLWILDEPLSALDVDSVDLMSELLTDHLDQNGLIVLTSHQKVDVAKKKINQLQLD
ncbi:MAG: cytochrome c biogenesis heme-transporting ATPase CcmA [Gammaproteobacteria bacterium]|nr:cytochrome c biogenesis heme-transporting ATPase CcmA [Gammaproteobacteria bacterium]